MQTPIDWQEAATEAFRRIISDSMTEPMSIEELCNIFGMGYRATKSHVSELDGVIRAGSFYRVPLRLMPSGYIAELQILAYSCAPQFTSTQLAIEEIKTSHVLNPTTTCDEASSQRQRSQHDG